MSMALSPKLQLFYDLSLNYTDLPDDLIDITEEQYMTLLEARNAGYHIFSDLTLSKKRQNYFETWDDVSKSWQDQRTPEEKAAALSYENKGKAQRLYDETSKKITTILQQIEDEDGDIDELKAQKTILSDYRKALRAYLKTDCLQDVPVFQM